MSPADSLVHSYLFLRRAIGIIGLGLPPVLVVGELLIGTGHLRNSISSYHNGDLRNVYVGALCAIGVFLLSYRGYERIDDITGNVGAMAAIGAALFPAAPPGETTRAQDIINVVHIGFGGLFLLTLAFFCWLFIRTDSPSRTPRKIARNRLYVACGVIILVSLALIVLLGWVFDRQVGALHPVLWLEGVATLAFGLAWLTKGEAILGDTSPTPEPAPAGRGQA